MLTMQGLNLFTELKYEMLNHTRWKSCILKMPIYSSLSIALTETALISLAVLTFEDWQ